MADHKWHTRMPVSYSAFIVVTGGARTDVVVRIARSIVPVRRAGTRVRTIAPIRTQYHGRDYP